MEGQSEKLTGETEDLDHVVADEINTLFNLLRMMLERSKELEAAMSGFNTSDPYFQGYARGMMHGYTAATDQIQASIETVGRGLPLLEASEVLELMKDLWNAHASLNRPRT